MVKLYFIECRVVLDGKISQSVELNKGEHYVYILPCDNAYLPRLARIDIDEEVKINSAVLVNTETNVYYAAPELNNAKHLPEIWRQWQVGSYLSTIWSDGDLYITVESDNDYYCGRLADINSEISVYENLIIISGEKNICILDKDLNVIAEYSECSYSVDSTINITVKYGGVINREIREEYDYNGKLLSRSIERQSGEYSSELTAAAFIECFITGDYETMVSMLEDELKENIDDIVNFVGKPLYIMTDDMPLTQNIVFVKYENSIKAFEIEISDNKITDINVHEKNEKCSE